jgi:subtilisin-like proprotein convertase family protein
MARHAATAQASLVLGLCIGAAAPVSAQVVGACCQGGGCTLTTPANCPYAYRGDFTDCQGGQPSIYHRAPNLAIPDLGCPMVVTDAVNVADSFPVTRVSVRVQVPNHASIADLSILLSHGGTSIYLFRGVCPSAGMDITFDDQGAELVCGTPTAGVFTPASAGGASLAAFNGAASAGPWTLVICDGRAFNAGTLASWTLVLRRAGPPPCMPDGPDCFTPPYPQVGGLWVRGGPNGVNDDEECLCDWDRSGAVTPSDLAAFIQAWFVSIQAPGTLYADIDCDGHTAPADVAYFILRWFRAVEQPGSFGCTS